MLTLATLVLTPALASDPIVLPVRNDITVALQADMRDCAAPHCGGWWYVEPHQLVTVCVDGTVADACYVADVDFSQVNLTPRQETRVLDAAENLAVFLHGDVVPVMTPVGPVATFVVTGGEKTFTR